MFGDLVQFHEYGDSIDEMMCQVRIRWADSLKTNTIRSARIKIAEEAHMEKYSRDLAR